MPRGQFEAEIWQEFIKPHPTEIPAPQQPDQLVQKEEVAPITYIGHVGQLDAIFFLKWLPGGKIQGTYFYPSAVLIVPTLSLARIQRAGKFTLRNIRTRN